MRLQHTFVWLSVVALPVFLLASCGKGGKSTSSGTMPAGAFGSSSDLPPPGAQMVSSDVYNKLVKAGFVLPAGPDTLKAQETADAAQEAADDQVISGFEAAHPGLQLLPNPPSPDDPSVQPDGAGNYIHTLALANGQTLTVTTMGVRWQKHMIANELRTFPTQANQLATYRMFYNDLSSSWRTQLSLPQPGSANASSAAQLAALNDQIAAAADSIAASISRDVSAPPGWVPQNECDHEIGWGGGSDMQGDNFTDPACGPQADGIYDNYTWPLKYDITCIRDQGRRGTCTAFADTAAIEVQVARQHGVWVNLSEQALYNRVKLVWAPDNYHDGMFSQQGFDNMAKEGWLIPFETQWPYNPSHSRIDGVAQCEHTCASDACDQACKADQANWWYKDSCTNYSDTCSNSSHQSELVCMNAGAWRFCGYMVPDKNPHHYGYRITTTATLWDPANVDLSVAKIIIAVALGNPVVIGHTITADWDAAAGKNGNGFLLYTGKNQTTRGGHGVVVVGSISNIELSRLLPNAPAGDGGGYFIIKNSWGNCSGDGGFMYVPYQSVKDWGGGGVVLHGVQ